MRGDPTPPKPAPDRPGPRPAAGPGGSRRRPVAVDLAGFMLVLAIALMVGYGLLAIALATTGDGADPRWLLFAAAAFALAAALTVARRGVMRGDTRAWWTANALAVVPAIAALAVRDTTGRLVVLLPVAVAALAVPWLLLPATRRHVGLGG